MNTVSFARNNTLPPDKASVVIALVVLIGVQPLANELYLPALPALPQAFGTTINIVQFTISIYIACFGICQLFFGPVSDRFGRKPVMMGGLALYTAASIAAIYSPGIGWFIFFRALQGMAIAACLTSGRAMIRDLYSPTEGAHVMARAVAWMSLFPLLCPLLGGVLTTYYGWEGAFITLSLFGVLGLTYIILHIPETLARSNPDALRLVPLFRIYRSIAQNPVFWIYTAVAGFTFAGLYSFISGAPYVLIEVFGLSRIQYGVVLSLTVTGLLFGSMCGHRIIPQMGIKRTLRLAGFVSLTSCIMMAGFALAGYHHVITLMLPYFVFVFAHGIHQPCGQVGAVGPFPEKAGSAAALSGFMVVPLAFATSHWIGWSYNHTMVPLALTISFWSFMLAVTTILILRRVV